MKTHSFKSMMTRRQLVIAGTLATLFCHAAMRVSVAAEGVSSSYFPGGYGDFAVATAPGPELIYANYNMFVDASVVLLEQRQLALQFV